MKNRINRVLFSCVAIVLLATGGHAFGQELTCKVTVVTNPSIQISNNQIFKSLETSIREFMSNRSWTTDKFGPNEKIECAISLTINTINGTEFSGNLQVMASRPAYGTNYNSVTTNILDKSVTFTYIEFQPLEYQEGVYITELTSLLSYYAYIILGYDYDS